MDDLFNFKYSKAQSSFFFMSIVSSLTEAEKSKYPKLKLSDIYTLKITYDTDCFKEIGGETELFRDFYALVGGRILP